MRVAAARVAATLMKFRGPLADSYPAAAALVVFALIPYLALSAALFPLIPVLTKSLGISQQSLELTTSMADAAYAFGTVMALQLAVHLPQRRMLIVYVSLFLVAALLAATEPTPGFFIGGYIVMGLCTSLMLIAAVPPLVTSWPTSKMPITGGIMNMCIFGAVALGPAIGGFQAGAKTWHLLFWLVVACSALAVVFSLLTYEDQPPQDESAPWDWVALALAGGGCAAAFFGAAELTTHPMLRWITIAPLVAGASMIVALIVYQYRSSNPLMPVAKLATTIPVAGVIVAMTAGASSFAVIELVQTAFKMKVSPTELGVLLLPEFGGAVITAVVFGALFRTRWVPVLAFAGMVFITGGSAVVTGVTGGSHTLVLVGSGLVGLGVGASVSPALFSTGFSLPPAQLQRVFALVELLRGVAAFMVAPIVMHLAMTVGPTQAAGLKIGIWTCLGIAALGGVVSAGLFVLGRARLTSPDLDRWQEENVPAWPSPPFLAILRRQRAQLTDTREDGRGQGPFRRESSHSATLGDGGPEGGSTDGAATNEGAGVQQSPRA